MSHLAHLVLHLVQYLPNMPLQVTEFAKIRERYGLQYNSASTTTVKQARKLQATLVRNYESPTD